MTIAIDSVCTHEQLADEIGGTAELENLLPESFAGESTSPRQLALHDVIKTLSRRTPPIREADLQDVTELRDAVRYGALERIYRSAMTGPDSPFAALQRIYERKFQAETLGLTPTIALDGSRGSAFAISMERR